MEIKDFNPITVLCFTKQVTLDDLQEFVRIKARELYFDAVKSNLEIAGPVYWIYYGMDGNPKTVFTLEVALPVSENGKYKGDFQIKKLRPFKCLSSWHKGSWEKLADTYGALFLEIGKKSYTHTGECREIYQHLDFLNEENNLTEVQVGIQ